jgi:hypothetical protein
VDKEEEPLDRVPDKMRIRRCLYRGDSRFDLTAEQRKRAGEYLRIRKKPILINFAKRVISRSDLEAETMLGRQIRPL